VSQSGLAVPASAGSLARTLCAQGKLLIDKMKIYQQFEKLVAEILRANEFIIEDYLANQDLGYDFSASLAQTRYLVEVKYYRTARAQVSLIESAAARLQSSVGLGGQSKGMLVVACNLQPELRVALEEKFGLVFVDRVDLFIWAARAPDLADELNALLEDRYLPRESMKGRTAQEIVIVEIPRKPAFPPDTKGTDLCRELRALKKGKASWSAYEKLCDKILRYLFQNDLHGWHTQKRTDDGLSRFDYVCRMLPNTDFWSFLIDHLNSRYVLFEFKNYSGKIKQGQVLTTEKYLLEKALRRIAIILSRNGAEKNAVSMTQGAMRESGKLMLILDDDIICNMLHMKERGDDPTDLLFELADEFLLTLPR
jgi:hypothetical protein